MDIQFLANRLEQLAASVELSLPSWRTQTGADHLLHDAMIGTAEVIEAVDACLRPQDPPAKVWNADGRNQVTADADIEGQEGVPLVDALRQTGYLHALNRHSFSSATFEPPTIEGYVLTYAEHDTQPSSDLEVNNPSSVVSAGEG